VRPAHRATALGLVLLVAAVGCGSGGGSASGNQQVRIAAAADLRYALDEIKTAFARLHPEVALSVTYGSSGTFFSQIENGAPFDLYLSADVTYPRKLLADALALPASEFDYAVGRIVVWVPRDSPLDVEEQGLNVLTDPKVRKIAIADPEHAPYGKAAVSAMTSSGVYDQVKGKLVLGENIAQAFQFVQSGAADVGIVALSLALAPSAQGRYWQVPLDAYPKIEQGGVILRSVRDLAATRSFVAFLTGDEGRATLRRYGFTTSGP
jgi:molybdate transport system substrate-binding protein